MRYAITTKGLQGEGPRRGVQNRVSKFQIQEYPISNFSCCKYRIFGKPVSEIETQYRISIFSKANIANLRSISNIGFSKSSISGIGNYPFRGPMCPRISSCPSESFPVDRDLSLDSSAYLSIIGQVFSILIPRYLPPGGHDTKLSPVTKVTYPGFS